MNLDEHNPENLKPEYRVNFIPSDKSINWDQYFMLQAMLASFKSKDPNTKVGSVFVDENNRQITMGYNGFVSGIDEDKLPWGRDTSVPLEFQKYGYVVHAEANAILHCTTPLENSKAYVTLFPCQECAKLIASKKVKEVIYLSDKYNHTEGNKISKKIFDLSGIRYRQLSIDDNILNKLNDYLTGLCQ